VEQLTIRISRVFPHGAELPLPQYATDGSAGMDILAALELPMTIAPGATVLIPSGFSLEIPRGFEAQIRPRSGLALKSNIGILNAPGTIDSDYRGEVKVIMTNFGSTGFIVNRGDRIAQMIIARYARVSWEESDVLENTTRGAGGFGHTGV
jgi:dUTP pyrophosphatase